MNEKYIHNFGKKTSTQIYPEIDLTFQRKHGHVSWDLYTCNQLYIRNHTV